MYAVGANERAARFCGIPSALVRISAYSICGLMASTAGIVLAARSGAAAPDVGSGFELDAIAAAVIGGVSIFGGAGGAGHAVRGVILLGMLSNFLVLAKQPYEMQRIITGAIIVLAIAVDKFKRGGSE